jgi:hypothetical protein
MSMHIFSNAFAVICWYLALSLAYQKSGDSDRYCALTCGVQTHTYTDPDTYTPTHTEAANNRGY